MRLQPFYLKSRNIAAALLTLATSVTATTARAGGGNQEWDEAGVADPRGCVSQSLQQLTTTSYGRRQVLESQIYKTKGKPFQTLVPTGQPHHFRITNFETLEEAVRSAERNHPFNLRDAIADAKRAMYDEVLPELHQLSDLPENASSGLRVTQRVKNLKTLKTKIFGRVAEEKSGPGGFDFAEIDDLAGARITTQSPADVDRVARRLLQVFGESRVNVEVKRKPGYRATHLTIRTQAGPWIEVQIMTERVLRWSNWDHDRVYKTALDKASLYYAKLKEYSQAVADYFRALDGIPSEDGSFKTIRPDPAKYGIRPEDVFPSSELH